jgi:hypothetical protein
MIVELIKNISKPGRFELKIDEPKNTLAGASYNIKNQDLHQRASGGSETGTHFP